jgi:hypothetical protein
MPKNANQLDTLPVARNSSRIWKFLFASEIELYAKHLNVPSDLAKQHEAQLVQAKIRKFKWQKKTWIKFLQNCQVLGWIEVQTALNVADPSTVCGLISFKVVPQFSQHFMKKLHFICSQVCSVENRKVFDKQVRRIQAAFREQLGVRPSDWDAGLRGDVPFVIKVYALA